MVDTAELDFAIKSGMKKGLELGRHEGLELGRHEGMELGRQNQERMLLRQMARRFGPVPMSLPEQLDRLTTAELEELAEAILDLNSYPEIEAWIASR